MRTTVVLTALAATAVTLTTPSFAAAPKLPKAKPLVVKDVAGDANGLGGQFGVPTPADNTSTPASVKDADILSFTLARLDDGKTVKGLRATLTLAAPPAQGRDYRIRMSAPGCTTYYLEYEYFPALGGQGEIRDTCDGGASATFTPVDAAVVGNSIVWTVTKGAFTGGVKIGTLLQVHGAEASVETAAIFPTLDSARTETTYRVGQ